MKLKYYLRGMGIGIILTAIVMGFALGGRKATISDAEVIERAKALGMVDPTSGVLTQTTGGADENEENTSTSSEALDQTGEEISEEVNSEFASDGESDTGLDETSFQGEEKAESESTEETADGTENTESAESVEKVEEDTVVAEEVKEEETAQAEEPATSDTASNKTETNGQTDSSSSESSTVAANTEQTTQNNTSGLGSKTTVTKTVTIPGGLGSEQVAAILAREGIVDSAYSFNQYLCDNRMDRKIRSGPKTIPAGSTYQDIARIICQ